MTEQKRCMTKIFCVDNIGQMVVNASGKYCVESVAEKTAGRSRTDGKF